MSFWSTLEDIYESSKTAFLKALYGPGYERVKDDLSAFDIDEIVGNVTDTVRDIGQWTQDVYEDTLSEETRMVLDPLIDVLPFVSDLNEAGETIARNEKYLEEHGLSYDDVVDKSDFNSGVSRQLESIYNDFTAKAPRGVRKLNDIYSR